MNVTSKISVDMTRQNVGQRVNAVQGDGNTRQVEIILLAGGDPWTPPEGVEAAIAYMQPGGTKGLYNKLADGTAAISISGNVATINLAPQMLTASGTVQASLVFNDQQLNRLTTFPFAVSVTSNPAAGAQKVEDYIRLQWLEEKLDEYLRLAKDSGEFDGKPGDNGVTFTPSVSENGDLSWRNNGGLPNPQTVNLRGPQGDSTAATAAANAAQTAAANAETHAADAAASSAAAQKAVVAMGPELSQIKNDLSDKLTAPDSGIEVGKYFRVAAIDKDGKAVLEACDLPIADINQPGLVGLDSRFGITCVDDKAYPAERNANEYKNSSVYLYVSKGTLDNVLANPSIMPALTSEEQAAARERMGIPGDYELIETISLTEEVSEIVRNTDTLGNQYSMKNLLLYVSAGKTTLKMSIRIEINGQYIIDTDNIGDNVYSFNYICRFAINNGILSTFLIGNRGSIQNRYHIYSSVYGMTTFLDTIKSVKLSITNPIEGATIKIYGVRA